jgi:hypothetical protein
VAVSHAEVRVYLEAARTTLLRTVETDETGVFYVYGLPVGTYYCAVDGTGIKTGTFTLSVVAVA